MSVRCVFGCSPAAPSRCFVYKYNPAHPRDMLENDADRQLLFGLLAIQLRVVSAAVVSDGLAQWSRSPVSSLKSILVDAGKLDATSGELIETAVMHHMALAQGDARCAWSPSRAPTHLRRS